MQSFSVKAIASILAFMSLTNAHMIMKTPVPFGRSTLNNSPLDASGSDFPCKMRGKSTFDAEGAQNILIKGQSNTLSFTGSAVHGGGSCQVSLTKGTEATKDSKWMVIKSIQGGCPADVAGNLPTDANGSGAATFQYTIPDSVADGDYVIAWTWFNKVGNREMYMNCGPATVQSSKKRYAPAPPVSKRQASSLPEMMVANIGNGCSTPDNMNILFPSPGSVLESSPEVASDTSGKISTKPVGNCGSSNVVAGSSPNSGSSSSAGAPAQSASSAQASIPVQPSASAKASNAAPSAATVSPGNFATGAASQAVSAAPTATATATAIVSALPSSAGAASPSATTGASSSPGTATGAQSGSCSPEGAWACAADGKSFQRCASQMWSAVMQMSAGTTCTPGISQDLNMNAVGGSVKRDLRSHFHRRHHQDSFWSF